MKVEIKNAVKKLVKKGGDTGNADDALKYTQAALNLAQVLAIIDNPGKK